MVKGPNKSRMLRLLKELIAINSENPPGCEAEVAKVLVDHMSDYGISHESIGHSDRPNLLFFSHEGETGPLVLHGHMDTVPVGPLENWTHDPFGGEIVNGKIYGRGSCDMKGALAALAETLVLYIEEGHDSPLVILNTSDEESGCSGAEEVARSGRLHGVRYGVCAEPTSLEVLVSEKGMFWSRVVARGKAAHGSRPSEGINAIQLCMRALDILTTAEYPFEDDATLGTYSLNIGKIKGGIKINVVPDYCEAQIDMRTVKGQTPESLQQYMNQLLYKAGFGDRVRIEYIHGKPAVITPLDSEIVNVAIDTVEAITGRQCIPSCATYGTDCSVLQPKIGIQNVICGPGSIEQAHQPNEFLSLDEFYKSVDVYLSIARRIAK